MILSSSSQNMDTKAWRLWATIYLYGGEICYPFTKIYTCEQLAQHLMCTDCRCGRGFPLVFNWGFPMAFPSIFQKTMNFNFYFPDHLLGRTVRLDTLFDKKTSRFLLLIWLLDTPMRNTLRNTPVLSY